jgi:hypothetical protein
MEQITSEVNGLLLIQKKSSPFVQLGDSFRVYKSPSQDPILSKMDPNTPPPLFV